MGVGVVVVVHGSFPGTKKEYRHSKKKLGHWMGSSSGSIAKASLVFGKIAQELEL